MATWVVNNYFKKDLGWINEYKPDRVIEYDKSSENKGSNIYDYMDYIISNYNNLPDIIVFAKGNMLERHISKEELDKVIHRKELTPLMTMTHRTYMPVCYYDNGLYWERNDYWYVNEHPSRNMEGLIDLLGIRGKEYLGFSPGGCWIVPKENILKHPRKFYARLKTAVDYDPNPAEAHLIERSLYHIWS